MFIDIMVIRSQSVALAFWKLNLAAIHEQGEGISICNVPWD